MSNEEEMPATTMIDRANSTSNAPAANEDLDLRARKRMEVGLAPSRPTAKAAVHRPPDYPTLPVSPMALALLLVAIVLITAVLLVMNLRGEMPGWLPAWTGLAANNRGVTSIGGANPPAQDYLLRLADDFSQNDSPLIQDDRPNEWRIELVPAESVYRMEVWPNHLAWSLLGLTDLQGYRLQTSVLVSAQTPGGYAGLIVRYQDERHFYLLTVDGNGRYQIQQQNGDEVIDVQPWAMAPFLTRAGSANLLTIEDDGERVLFYGNNVLIAELSDPAYPLGSVGLAGGAQGQAVGEIRFDWFQLFDAASIPE